MGLRHSSLGHQSDNLLATLFSVQASPSSLEHSALDPLKNTLFPQLLEEVMLLPQGCRPASKTATRIGKLFRSQPLEPEPSLQDDHVKALHEPQHLRGWSINKKAPFHHLDCGMPLISQARLHPSEKTRIQDVKLNVSRRKGTSAIELRAEPSRKRHHPPCAQAPARKASGPQPSLKGTCWHQPTLPSPKREQSNALHPTWHCWQ